MTSFAVGVTSATVPAALGGNMTAALTTGTNSWNQLQSAFPAAGVTQTVAGLTIAIGPLTTDVGATITDVPTAEPRIIARSGDVCYVGRHGAVTLTPEAVKLTAVKFTSDFD